MVVLAADVIAAEARLNIRVCDAKDERKLGEQDVLELLEHYDELHQACRELAAKFERDGDVQDVEQALIRIRREFDELTVS